MTPTLLGLLWPGSSVVVALVTWLIANRTKVAAIVKEGTDVANDVKLKRDIPTLIQDIKELADALIALQAVPTLASAQFAPAQFAPAQLIQPAPNVQTGITFTAADVDSLANALAAKGFVVPSKS